MKLDVRTPFACKAEELWAITGDPVFMAQADEEAEITRLILESRTLPDKRRQNRTRYTSKRPLSPVAARIMGVQHVSYEQIEIIDDSRLSLDWEVKSPIGGDRFDARGTYRILPAIPGCERVVQGEIRVSVALVGGQIEKQIVSEIQHSYERSADVLRRWLLGQRKI